MIILSHRGYWKSQEEKNKPEAFTRSFRLGYGTETDLRDDRGTIVISHDPPCGGECTFRELLQLHQQTSPETPLALNIKADGLQSRIKGILSDFPKLDYFCFDMSIPDTLGYTRENIVFFTRQSELEPTPALLSEAAGVWMDMFTADWIEERDVVNHLGSGKRVCLVSPDLHKRDPHFFWDRVRQWNCAKSDDLLLCTDHPEDATGYFSK